VDGDLSRAFYVIQNKRFDIHRISLTTQEQDQKSRKENHKHQSKEKSETADPALKNNERVTQWTLTFHGLNGIRYKTATLLTKRRDVGIGILSWKPVIVSIEEDTRHCWTGSCVLVWHRSN
jgi:hypothetical protein